jgi:hypothetical protein
MSEFSQIASCALLEENKLYGGAVHIYKAKHATSSGSLKELSICDSPTACRIYVGTFFLFCKVMRGELVNSEK